MSATNVCNKVTPIMYTVFAMILKVLNYFNIYILTYFLTKWPY